MISPSLRPGDHRPATHGSHRRSRGHSESEPENLVSGLLAQALD
jgi:hypothetical protein